MLMPAAGDARPDTRTELFAHVVRREPGWASWAGRPGADPEASRLFRAHFPLFLSELLDDANGGASNTALARWAEGLDPVAGTLAMLGRLLVGSHDAQRLRRAAGAAREAGKATTAHWLERTAAGWAAVCGWIEDGGDRSGLAAATESA